MEKFKSNNLILSKADKGKTFIALDKQEHLGKQTLFLNSSSYKIMKWDSVNNFQKQIETAIGSWKSIISEKYQYKIILSNLLSPQINYLIKLHKSRYPIRSVVSYVSAPATKVWQPRFAIKNSVYLVNKIHNLDWRRNVCSVRSKNAIILVESLSTRNCLNRIICSDIISP